MARSRLYRNQYLQLKNEIILACKIKNPRIFFRFLGIHRGRIFWTSRFRPSLLGLFGVSLSTRRAEKKGEITIKFAHANQVSAQIFARKSQNLATLFLK